MVTCPECDESLTIPGTLRRSEILECRQCRSELEVVAVDPVMVALAPEIEEDWGE